MSEHRKRRITRRAAIGGLAAAPALLSPAFANRHPAPRPTSLKYLDRNMYRKDADVRAIFELGRHRGNKIQMMAIGDRRFLFQAGDVIEVTDALKPVMFNRQGFGAPALLLSARPRETGDPGATKRSSFWTSARYAGMSGGEVRSDRNMRSTSSRSASRPSPPCPTSRSRRGYRR